MKKLFLVLLCAGLFVACGNKNKQEEPVVEPVAEEVTEAPAQEEAVVAEEPVQEQKAAPAKQTTKPKQPVKEHAQSAAENVANAAIDQAEKDATSNVNKGVRRR